MKDPKLRFSDRVENYVRYRPGYPPEIVRDLERHGHLSENATIADIGSGTGILTSRFLARDYRCYAVEPNAAMRTAAERQLGDSPGFTSVDGSAEATGLDDASVDLVTAGQAFHWFDRERCRVEFRRILRPGGSAALIWNERDHRGSAFQAGYEQMLHDHGTDYAAVDYKNVGADAIRELFAPLEPAVLEYDNQQSFDLDGLKGRLLSSSYCPLPGEAGHADLMAAAEHLFAGHQQDGRVTFSYRTTVHVGRMK